MDELILDEEGDELANLQVARDEAHAAARDFASNDLRQGQAVGALSIEIANASGSLLDVISIREIL